MRIDENNQNILIEIGGGWKRDNVVPQLYKPRGPDTYKWVRKIELVERATINNHKDQINKSKNNTMIKGLKNRFTPEPKKSLLEAGVISGEDDNGSYIFTEDGLRLFRTFIVNNTIDFLEMVQEANKEAKKRK